MKKSDFGLPASGCLNLSISYVINSERNCNTSGKRKAVKLCGQTANSVAGFLSLYFGKTHPKKNLSVLPDCPPALCGRPHSLALSTQTWCKWKSSCPQDSCSSQSKPRRQRLTPDHLSSFRRIQRSPASQPEA